MRLWVKYGKSLTKNDWFRPRLTIRSGGFADNHWLQQHFRSTCGSVGSGLIFPRVSLAEALADYMAELKRMNYQYEWRER